MFRGPLESGAPPPWVGKMMKTSKDVGLVVVGADLVGLVDANTHLGWKDDEDKQRCWSCCCGR